MLSWRLLCTIHKLGITWFLRVPSESSGKTLDKAEAGAIAELDIQ